MEHARGGEDNHRAGVVNVGAVIRLDVLEVEHISVNKGLPDLFVRPGDEHLIIVVRFLGHARAEVDGALQVHPLPVGFKQDAEFLSSSQGENWNQHFSSFIDAVVDFLQEIALSAPLAISDCRGISRFCYQEVWSALVDPGGSKVPGNVTKSNREIYHCSPVRSHVVIPCVHH